jgi:glycosyltransferase involved in cell wall biosynthesis
MVAHAYYDEDPRVRREAEALVAAGWEVDALALRRPGDGERDELGGVRVRRLDVRRHQGAPVPVYLWEYLDFLVRSAVALTVAHRRQRYALVQVHTIPDFLVFAALPLRWAGVPVVLDFHEAMPEFFGSRFPRASNPLTRRLLTVQETASAATADAIIAVNEAVAERLAHRGVPPAKITVVRNSPSPALFDLRAHPRRAFMDDGTVRLVYTGALTPNYELDVLLDAVARLMRERPGLSLRLDVYGRGDSESTLRDQAAALGLESTVGFHGRVPLEHMAVAIAEADIGVAPIRRNAQTELSLPTKILEYAVMGKPVIASDLVTVVRSFDEKTLVSYPAGDSAGLAAGILRLVDAPAAAAKRVKRTAARVAEMSWGRESATYVALIERLAGSGP